MKVVLDNHGTCGRMANSLGTPPRGWKFESRRGHLPQGVSLVIYPVPWACRVFRGPRRVYRRANLGVDPGDKLGGFPPVPKKKKKRFHTFVTENTSQGPWCEMEDSIVSG